MAFLKDLFPKSSGTQRTRIQVEHPDRKIAPASDGGRALRAAANSGFPLALAQAGEAQRVTSIKGKDDTKRFLGSLGFAEGAEVTLISEMNGNVIVNVKGTRVAVSKAMAMRVYVA